MSKASATPPTAALAWPYPVIWFADHWTRDCANYWRRMSLVTDPVEAVQAEGALGADLLRDSLTAWSDFWMIPIRVWSAAASAPTDAD